MTAGLFAELARIHGHLAVLGLAVLLHPVLTLGRPGGLSRGTRLSARIAALLIALPTVGGWLLYPPYRQQVKPRLVHEDLSVALAFETKEHLAFFCLALALGGVLLLEVQGGQPATRRVARVLLLLAWLVGVGVAGLGIGIAGFAWPAW